MLPKSRFSTAARSYFSVSPCKVAASCVCVFVCLCVCVFLCVFVCFCVCEGKDVSEFREVGERVAESFEHDAGRGG